MLDVIILVYLRPPNPTARPSESRRHSMLRRRQMIVAVLEGASSCQRRQMPRPLPTPSRSVCPGCGLGNGRGQHSV